MNDMTSVIVPRSDQINSDDLLAGPITITIREVQVRGGQEQPVSIYFDGSDKAFRPCKSMSRVLVAAWGANSAAYVGRSLSLYRDASVKWGGMEVGGIRISHMTHIDGAVKMALTATKGSRKMYVVEPLKDAPKADDPAQTWTDKFIAKIDTFDNRDDLTAFEAGQEKRLSDLKAKRPELHASIGLAIANKLESFGTGPADTQRGEQTTFATAADEIEASTTPEEVDGLFAAHIGAMNDDEAERLITVRDARLAEISA